MALVWKHGEMIDANERISALEAELAECKQALKICEADRKTAYQEGYGAGMADAKDE